jgi:hypothetical protein
MEKLTEQQLNDAMRTSKNKQNEALENFKQELFKSLKIPQFVDWLSNKLKK